MAIGRTSSESDVAIDPFLTHAPPRVRPRAASACARVASWTSGRRSTTGRAPARSRCSPPPSHAYGLGVPSVSSSSSSIGGVRCSPRRRARARDRVHGRRHQGCRGLAELHRRARASTAGTAHAARPCALVGPTRGRRVSEQFAPRERERCQPCAEPQPPARAIGGSDERHTAVHSAQMLSE
jgi:hypothetical protein